MGILKKIGNRLRNMQGTMDQYQQEITFAEAGSPRPVGEKRPSGESLEMRGKLLVVGNESTFTRSVIDYAIEMAERMSYDIVALNTAPLSCETFKFLSFSQSSICKEFQEFSEKNVIEFSQLASRKGIGFAHVVKFKEAEAAIEEIGREYPIDFVIEEPENRAANRLGEDNRPRQEVFVYTMV